MDDFGDDSSYDDVFINTFHLLRLSRYCWTQLVTSVWYPDWIITTIGSAAYVQQVELVLSVLIDWILLIRKWKVSSSENNDLILLKILNHRNGDNQQILTKCLGG